MPLNRIASSMVKDKTLLTVDIADNAVTGSKLQVDTNLGVGTTSPNGALHVKGISDHGRIIVEHGGTSGSTNHNYISFHNHAGNTVAEIQSNETATDKSALIFKTGGTTTGMTISKDGYITKPLQPAFLVKPNANQNSLATDTYHTVIFDTEIFDQNADFNHTNYTFTAPVTGKYQLNTSVYLYNIDKDADYYLVYIDTSNNDYQVILDPGGYAADINYQSWVISTLADMDADDTALVKVYQQAGAAQCNLITGGYTWFSGVLVA